MKARILNLLIWIISLAFSQESTWKKSPTEIAWNSIFHRMTFRHPVVFTPLEVKAGYLNYGGNNYWSKSLYNSTSLSITDIPVLLDSTQYQFNIIDNVSDRMGIFIEIDFLRTNLPHFIVHQNYFDFQLGLGIQMINFFSNPELPSDIGKKWKKDSGKGNYYFNPRAVGINLNTSLGWQLSRKRLSYIYHSLGINSISLYASEAGDHTLKGVGLSESFGIGTKYIFWPERGDFNYTFGIELKWNRLYMKSAEAIEGLSPIHGIDIRASGIFFTTGIQFGGKHTDGDIAYSYMMENDFISAAESFETFLVRERRHGKRHKAIEMLQYCKSQITYQKVRMGVEDFLQSDFDEAVEWFNSAEADADDSLKNEIRTNRKKIAAELLDSVQNYRNKMSLKDAEKLVTLAGELYPGYQRQSKVMAELYMEKANLDTKIGNYSGAVENYYKALELDPYIEMIVMEKLIRLAQSFMEDAYNAYNENELYLVLKSIKSFIKLQPQMSGRLESYILKLETHIKSIQNQQLDKHLQEYIIDIKHESLNLPEPVLLLGMSDEDAKIFHGTPLLIDKHIEQNQLFEMWTYPEGENVSQLYFKNSKLIRIVK